MTHAELERLFALLRVPSVSAVAAHDPDMAVAADLCAAEIRRADADAEIHHEGRHPLVIGRVAASAGGAAAPTVMVYGHYDVQPPGPLELWTSPPFAPEVRGEHLYARGASDDKGNLMMLLVAVQRLRADGRLPVNVRFVIDGEEESGGTSAVDWLANDRERDDCCLIFDAPMVAPDHAAVTVGARGLLYRRVLLRAAGADAHSGLYGGAALNAASALAGVLAAVGPRDGRLPEPLRQGVVSPSDAERASWASLPGGTAMLDEAGLRPLDEAAASEFALRTGCEPSLDVHGLSAGEVDAVKTVIPATATATLSVRLAPGQSSRVVGPALDRLLHDAASTGAELTIEHLGEAEPALVAADDPWVTRAMRGISASTGLPVAPVRMGGTIPILASLAGMGVTPILTGFGLTDDAIHAPNERIRVALLDVGVRAAMGILMAFGGE